MPHTEESIREKREERARLVAQAQTLIEGSGKDSNIEDTKKFDDIMTDVDKLKAQIDRMERLASEEKDLDTKIEMRAGRENTTKGEAEKSVFDESKVYDAFLRLGYAGLNAQSQAVMNKHKAKELNALLDEAGLGIYAAQSVGTNTAGGFTVAEDSSFMSRLQSAMLAFGGMREVATEITTATGASLPMPSENNTSQEGEILGEATPSNEEDLVVGQISLDAFKYSTKRIKISMELVQDSAFNFEQFIAGKLAERRARITNRHFTVGTGTGQPNGIVTASTLGKTGAAGQTTTVVYDDLVDLLHSVDPSYRANARWMMHDNTVAILRKLKDGNGLPLWQAGVVGGSPDTILGKPMTVNQHMDVMAASAKSILFGDFSKYWIRNVRGLVVARLSELYMESAQIGFVGFSREDGELIDAGTNPVKHYANAAS